MVLGVFTVLALGLGGSLAHNSSPWVEERDRLPFRQVVAIAYLGAVLLLVLNFTYWWVVSTAHIFYFNYRVN